MTLFSSVFAHQFQCCSNGSRNKPISDSHVGHIIFGIFRNAYHHLEMEETSLLVFVLRVHLESIKLMTEVIPVPLGLLPIVTLNWLHQKPNVSPENNVPSVLVASRTCGKSKACTQTLVHGSQSSYLANTFLKNLVPNNS